MEPWAHNSDICPADDEFVEFAKDSFFVHGTHIFHMGPGLHHNVSLLCGLGAMIHSVTLSYEEQTSAPKYGGKYRCSVSNIYDSPVEFDFSTYDMITLFHLGETPRPPSSDIHDWNTYAGMVNIIDAVVKYTEIGQVVVFYTKSSAWDRLEPIVQRAFDAEWESVQYKSLRFYRRKA